MQSNTAQPIAWRWLLIPALIQLLLHLFTSGRFGIFRDEYYYLACAARPAWGYVDQPSFSIWMLTAWKTLFGDSVYSLRILPALCGSGLVLLTGMTSAQLGGARWAQLLAALSVAFGMVALVISGLYSMNAFDFLFSLGVYYLLIRITRSGDGKSWVWFGLVLGLGLFNKIGLLVFCVALLIGLLATGHRRHLKDPRLYLAGAIALAFLLPYALWNQAHGWPVLEFMENAKEGKIAAFTPWEFLSENILEANPLTLPVWVGGLAWLLFARSARRFQIVGLIFVASFVILNLQRSKPYYFAASFPVLMAAGGVAWEQWTRSRRWLWVRWVMTANLVIGGCILLPMAVPLLSPGATLSYLHRIGLVPAPQEVGHTSPLPQYFADRFGWENLAQVVSEVYRDLPTEEQEHCVVIGQNYGHAGAIEYWARKYPLPAVYSRHNNYWFWGPPPADATVMIVVRGNEERLREMFSEVQQVAVASSPDAVESSMTIWLCRGPRGSIAEYWASHRAFG